jgi:hypothetical protein
MLFGLMSAGVSLANIGLNAYEAVKANRDMKKFSREADKYAGQYSQGRMTDYMAGLQAPDISSLAEEENRRAMAQGVDVLAQGGAESAIGGAANMVQASMQNQAKISQDQALLNQATQEKKLMSKQAIEEEAFGRQKEAEAWRLGNAVSQQQQAAAAKQNAFQGISSGIASGLTGVSSLFDPATGKFLYGKKKAPGNTNKDINLFGDANTPVIGLGGQQLGVGQSQIDWNSVFSQQQAP